MPSKALAPREPNGPWARGTRVPQEERRPGSRRRNDDRGPAGGTTTGVPQEERIVMQHTHEVGKGSRRRGCRKGIPVTVPENASRVE
ncbi:MAG: hypothetical protein LC808_23230, partial [Actinobacteria bacterium]|nr:hypothetical protein [Actinomycetota bacterium]